MKNLLLSIALLAGFVVTHAQVTPEHPYTGEISKGRKLVFLGTEGQLYREPNAVNGKMSGYTQVVFKLSETNQLDTSVVFNIQFYPSGFAKVSEYYDFMSQKEFAQLRSESRADIQRFLSGSAVTAFAARFSNRRQKGTRIVYTYDASDNLINKKLYKVAPANSIDAVGEFLMNYARGGRRHAEVDQDEKQQAASFEKSIDSLARLGLPEVASQTKETRYAYNEDNNLVSSQEVFSRISRQISYQHYDDGRIRCRREIYHSGSSYTTMEDHITYTANGQISTFTAFLAESDSGDIAVEKYRRGKEEFTYNTRGLYERLVSTKSGSEEQRLEINSYKDTLMKRQVKLILYPATKKTDTTSDISYSYSKGRITVIKKRYSGKVVYLIEKEEKYFDDKGLLIRIEAYNINPKEPKGPGKLVKKDLYFYER